MNEFTKEELESIANWGNVYCEFGHSWVYKTEQPLLDKIQRMIETYDTPESIRERTDIHGGNNG